MTNYLILYTSTNSKGKHDATGAFVPEAKRLEEYLLLKNVYDHIDKYPIHTTGKSLAQRREQVEIALKMGTYDHVFFLCHGYKHGIQFGYKWRWGAVRLAKFINLNSHTTPSVTFYCCSVATGSDNFSKWVFDELSCRKDSRENVQVFGHYTAGHTTMNPNIKIYATGYKPFMWSNKNYNDYNQLVPSGKDEAKKRMRDSDNDLRFSMPFYVDTMRDGGYDWSWE